MTARQDDLEASLGRDPEVMADEKPDDVCCFGMVIGLGFRPSKQYVFPQLPIGLSIEAGSDILLESHGHEDFGRLDPTGRKIVNVLRKELTIQLFADYNAFRTQKSGHIMGGTPEDFKFSKLQPPLELFAILYGPSTLFEAIGAFAAKCHLYLQHPRHCNRNVPYRNPHCLSPEDGRIVYTYDIQSMMEASNFEPEISGNHIDLFADATEHDALSDACAPRALSTELYKHQKQALTFMVQRERGWAMDGHHKDIWREESDSFGRSTYQNLISGMKQMTRPNEFRGGLLVDAPGLGKSLSVLALISSDAETENQSPPEYAPASTTLLIVPKTLIQTWKDELQKHLRSPEFLRYCVYYGKDRTKHLDQLKDYRLVITTYSLVRSDWKKWLAEPNNNLTLHAKSWRRVVLDEAHIIREPSKSFAKSTCALQAERRWAVTASPIQNRLTDLFSLFKFLRCSPFDDQKVFNSHVIQRWKATSDPDSVAKLKTLVNCLSLRRPKTTIELPPRKDVFVDLQFNEHEWEHYRRARSKALDTFKDAGEHNPGATLLNALQWINELRLICNHGTMKMKGNTQIVEEPSAWSMQEAQIRFDQLEAVGLAKCSNAGCCQDLASALWNETGAEHEDEPWISDSLELWCSLCSKGQGQIPTRVFRVCNHLPRRFQNDDTRNKDPKTFSTTTYLSAPGLGSPDGDNRLPTKVGRLLSDLLETPDGTKSVVFSSWTKTFDIVQPQLCAHSIRCVRLDGTLSANGRANVLRVFRTEPEIRVLLATISCGGIGIDLTTASRAYIMEPQWNPMSESQALDRIYRLGQLKEVTTIRYIMRGSWEEQVLKLQRRKQELADLTLGSGGIRRTDLTFGRLQYLKQLLG